MAYNESSLNWKFLKLLINEKISAQEQEKKIKKFIPDLRDSIHASTNKNKFQNMKNTSNIKLLQKELKEKISNYLQNDDKNNF